jgi:hypothetical protein
MPNWMYEIINYPEDYQGLGYLLIGVALLMIVRRNFGGNLIVG